MAFQCRSGASQFGLALPELPSCDPVLQVVRHGSLPAC
ncbi:Uncharacterised protein [Vibrio cholerae]|nr:Uncharacterised protein [Vibrio cholerae]